MASEAIAVRVHIGDAVYSVDLVGDPSDAMLGVQIGRGVAVALLSHAATVASGALDDLAAARDKVTQSDGEQSVAYATELIVEAVVRENEARGITMYAVQVTDARHQARRVAEYLHEHGALA